MKLKAITRTAVVATGVAIAGLSLATTASAASNSSNAFNCPANCTSTLSGEGTFYQAQVNNNQTGPGVTSWIWVFTNESGDHVDYFLNGDQTMHTMFTGDNSSNSMNLSLDVTAFRVCGPSHAHIGDECSPFLNPAF